MHNVECNSFPFFWIQYVLGLKLLLWSNNFSSTPLSNLALMCFAIVLILKTIIRKLLARCERTLNVEYWKCLPVLDSLKELKNCC